MEARRAEAQNDDATFKYKPLRDDEIRLVRILPSSKPQDVHCAMETHANYFQGTVQYTALSYCWGDVNLTSPITLDGCPFYVTINLKEALGAILEHHTELGNGYYWIDALCIDQANGDERNHQVHQMWRIFSSAHQVFSWLGAEDEHLQPALMAVSIVSESCRYPGTHCSGWKKHHHFPSISLMEHLRQVMKRPYFGRTWVIQEFVQARRLWLLCGKHRLDCFELFHFQKALSGSQAGDLLNHRWQHGPDRKSDPVPHDVLQAILWLVTTLSSYARSACSDTRDRIYALLGDPTIRKLDPSMGLRPDYSLQLESVAITFIEHCDKIIEWFYEDDEEVESEYMKAYVNRLLASLAKAINFESKESFTDAIKRHLLRYGYHTGAVSVDIQADIKISLTGHIMKYLTGSFIAISSKSSTSTVTILKTVHSFTARSVDELSLKRGDRIELIERDDEYGDGWFIGRNLSNGNTGLFPEVYTLPVPSEHADREGNIQSKQTTEAEIPRNPAVDLLTQELDDFHTAWEAGMEPPPLQTRNRTSMNSWDEPDPDHFGASHRALIADRSEYVGDIEVGTQESNDSEGHHAHKPGLSSTESVASASSPSWIHRMTACAEEDPSSPEADEHQTPRHTAEDPGQQRQSRRSKTRARQSRRQESLGDKQIEHQPSLRSLLGDSDMTSENAQQRILQSIHADGLLDRIDIDNLTAAQEEELTEHIAEAYRRRHRDRTTSKNRNGFGSAGDRDAARDEGLAEEVRRRELNKARSQSTHSS